VRVKLLLLLVSTVVTLAIVELVLDYTVFDYQHNIEANSDNPVLHFELTPHPPSMWTDVFGEQYEVRINRHGMRGPEVEQRKAEGVFRVAVVGDSFVFGAGVEESATLPAQLEARLAERAGQPLEVLNFGVGAYNALQESELIATRVLDFAPDLLIWVYYINDLEEQDHHPFVLEHCGVPVGIGEGIDDWLRRYFKLYRLAVHRTRYSMDKETMYEPGGLALRCYRRCAQRVGALARERGLPVILAFLPFPGWEGIEPWIDPRDRPHVETAAREQGFVYTDLTEALRGHPVDAITNSVADRHLNRAGYALLAAHLAEIIVTNQLAKPRADEKI